MAGGKNKIHEHPKANTNGFKQHPERAGRPKGSKDFNTLVKEALRGKGEYELSPREVLAREWVDVLLNKDISEQSKLKALKELTDRLEGSITTKSEVSVSTPVIEVNTKEQEELLKDLDI